MSKIVVVLVPGGASELLTVDDSETAVSWATGSGGAQTGLLPIETYYCEGEEFYFARVENLSSSEIASVSLN
ncbi:UNVERIFIED_ORG: hypothetical protein J2806_002577 [Kosakonia oryzae]|uniref:Uncharacterized protein n=1 Tax=Kosakonia radicincitans TaxID=283686 RepID=A0AAX2EP77_9ENTR|nr:hypothetical protein [Kosakonia radicincitans]MDP9566905.1 hypothetical protein [Kosakonia oryzae]APG18154.1 hypothetical protein A3780_11520 [Kosakonia radicincitans]SFE78056.1 hypothetical protein SAMN03159468_02766 [Kosakonia radicincitans]SFR04441.1 hypothetical protein SAMN03159514_01303 [Kosakonia radicincitans]SFT55904.1 hypothetical protein SAMN03159428_01041 [Kosakonia radicincitans]